MARRSKNLTAIELGASTIKVCMGVIGKDDTLTLIGHQETPAQDSIRKGEIINAGAVVDLLTDSLNRLERSTGKTVGPVYLAVTGNHFASTNANGSVPVTAADHIISEQDIMVATQNARDWSLPADRLPIHSYRRAYIIDGARRVGNPLGMAGSHLNADIHMIYASHNHIEALLKLLMNVLGEPVADIVFSGVASFYGLEPCETARHGVLVIDLGAGVTEYVLFYDEGCMHSGQISVGCDHLANDLALGLRLPLNLARQLVRQHGSAILRPDASQRQVRLPGTRRRMFSESSIHKVMELRLQELFEIIRDELTEHNLRGMLGDGVVIGGGGALIPEITELAQQVFQTPARVGRPRELPGMDPKLNDPRMLTPIGLLCLGQQLQQMELAKSPPLPRLLRQELGALYKLCRRAIKF